MAPIATITGALLCVLGALFYGLQDPDHRSATALIPLFLGFPIAICGILARKENLRKHAMHGAAGLALFGLLGSLMGVPKWLNVVRGGEVARPLAAMEQFIMFIICVVFLVLCIRSFIAARKAPTTT